MIIIVDYIFYQSVFEVHHLGAGQRLTDFFTRVTS